MNRVYHLKDYISNSRFARYLMVDSSLPSSIFLSLVPYWDPLRFCCIPSFRIISAGPSVQWVLVDFRYAPRIESRDEGCSKWFKRFEMKYGRNWNSVRYSALHNNQWIVGHCFCLMKFLVLRVPLDLNLKWHHFLHPRSVSISRINKLTFSLLGHSSDLS